MRIYEHRTIIDLANNRKIGKLCLVTKQPEYLGAPYKIYIYKPSEYSFGPPIYQTNSYRQAMRFLKHNYIIKEQVSVLNVWSSSKVFLLKS